MLRLQLKYNKIIQVDFICDHNCNKTEIKILATVGWLVFNSTFS